MVELIQVKRQDRLETIIRYLRDTKAERVLFYLPPSGEAVLAEPVDMARLRQEAGAMGKKIGVVALDGRVRQAGRLVGVPVFIWTLAGRYRLAQDRPWWWPEPPLRAGKATELSAEDRQAISQRLRQKPRWFRYSNRYLNILIFGLTIAFVTVAALYALPTATITIAPHLQQLQIAQPIVVDPRFDKQSADGLTVPGRLLVTVDKWRASIETTGNVEQPASPARGTVTFANRGPQAITIPAGTRVGTSSGERLTFQTVREATLAPKLGAEVDVEVVAIQMGTQGNVPPNSINRIEGPLAPFLNVRNLFQMSGGGVRFAPAVAEEDVERLRNHVIETIFFAAKADMTRRLERDEFLVEDSVRLIVIYEETYDFFVGDETELLTMELRAELHGTAVDRLLALELINGKLLESVPSDYTIVPQTILTQMGEVKGVDPEGRVSVEMVGSATLAAKLTLSQPIEAIIGQPLDPALRYLDQELLLREPPTVVVWPRQFSRIPYSPARVYTHLDTTP